MDTNGEYIEPEALIIISPFQVEYLVLIVFVQE